MKPQMLQEAIKNAAQREELVSNRKILSEDPEKEYENLDLAYIIIDFGLK